MAEQDKERSKTKEHWQVLRNALLSKSNQKSLQNAEKTASSVSTMFFPIFSAKEYQLQQIETMSESLLTEYKWTSYDIVRKQTQHSTASTRHIIVRERCRTQKIAITELISHELNNGVDNTGNIRTWISEHILLAYILNHDISESLYKNLDSSSDAQSLRCCELGAGMAGFASLGLLAHSPVPIEKMLITDGNPISVANLQQCVDANVRNGFIHNCMHDTKEVCIEVNLLRWNRHAQMLHAYTFDLVFASDCLFFEEFHQDLAHTISQLLRPITGLCLLLQPRRNGSMDRFIQIATSYHLHVNISEDYDEEITTLHRKYKAEVSTYTPDVHYPILLTIHSTKGINEESK